MYLQPINLFERRHVKQKRQWTVCLPVDIPMGWEPQRNLAVRTLRVAFADFSATPWQGFEKSERGPNNSSLFQPLAAVVVVAVQVLLSAVVTKEGVYSEINQRQSSR